MHFYGILVLYVWQIHIIKMFVKLFEVISLCRCSHLVSIHLLTSCLRLIKQLNQCSCPL